jgi:dihydrofolate reductase
MRKLIVSMNLTLDGYYSGPDGELDWHLTSWTTEMGDAMCSQLAKADTILLGRITYNAMAAYCSIMVAGPSRRSEEFAFANMMNCCTKIVFSKTIVSASWKNTELLKGNLAYQTTRLKKKPGGDIIVYGSSQLVDGLIKADLVDEYRLWIHPVILGKGKSLFRNNREKHCLNLMDTETFPSGVVMMRYRPSCTRSEQ